MSTGKKIRHKTQTAKGRAKKAAGRATGNRKLAAKGRTEEVKGTFMQAVDRFMAAFKR